MNIKTKFEIGNVVFALEDGRVINNRITRIVIDVNQNSTHPITIKYGLYCFHGLHDERKVFSTKQELLDSL